MLPYAYHSESALTAELADVKRLRILVNEMKKPDNFTYIDIVKLHKCLEELEAHLRARTKEKTSC